MDREEQLLAKIHENKQLKHKLLKTYQEAISALSYAEGMISVIPEIKDVFIGETVGVLEQEFEKTLKELFLNEIPKDE